MARDLDRTDRFRVLANTGAVALPVGGLAWWLVGPSVGVGLGLLLALLVWTLLRRRGAAASWRAGARGERRTARRLDRLRRRGFTVLHDLGIPGSAANLDHVVVGAAGVVVVDSKYRSGHVRFSGRSGHVRIGNTGAPLLVKSVRWEADKVSRILEAELGRSISVRAALAVHVPRSRIPGWRRFECYGIPILPADSVNRWVLSLDPELSSSEISVVVNVVQERFAPHTQQ